MALDENAQLHRRLENRADEQEALEQQRDELELERDELADRLREAEAAAEQLKRNFAEALAHAGNDATPAPETDEDEAPTEFKDVRAAVDAAVDRCPHLAFAHNAFDSADDSPFENTVGAFDALMKLERLASLWARLEGIGGMDLGQKAAELGLNWKNDVGTTARASTTTSTRSCGTARSDGWALTCALAAAMVRATSPASTSTSTSRTTRRSAGSSSDMSDARERTQRPRRARSGCPTDQNNGPERSSWLVFRSYMPQVHAYSNPTRAALRLLGQNIALGRKRRQMTVAELAERVGASRTTIRHIELGEPSVRIGLVFEAATLVGVPLFDANPEVVGREVRRTSHELSLLPEAIRRPQVNDDF
jgi:transcriptional regulator with XRE-family HTH domain